MINLELPDKLKNLSSSINNLANNVLRPVSRKYDENEHEYPTELDMFRGMKIMGKPKKKEV